MNNNLLFSVLIANYNNGQYIQEAIESVKAQDYDHWEIIIVDDASTDNSIEIYNKKQWKAYARKRRKRKRANNV